MSLNIDNGRVVHYPKKADRFEFDGEVSIAFPDMAVRSIPMYAEAHRVHVSMLRDVLSRDSVCIYDIGASRGHLIKEICNQLQIPLAEGRPGLEYVAVDSSFAMLNLLAKEVPWAEGMHYLAQHLPPIHKKVDIISMFYVLQFIENDKDKMDILQWAASALKPGGVLLLGQKHATTETYDKLFTDEYYRFRQHNGYTLDEIRAKTEALKGSMWPIRSAWLEDMCIGAGFTDYVETTRWLQFSTSMCVMR